MATQGKRENRGSMVRLSSGYKPVPLRLTQGNLILLGQLGSCFGSVTAYVFLLVLYGGSWIICTGSVNGGSRHSPSSGIN
jgi:hypothetical protein